MKSEAKILKLTFLLYECIGFLRYRGITGPFMRKRFELD
jgi:hypothetical protein